VRRTLCEFFSVALCTKMEEEYTYDQDDDGQLLAGDDASFGLDYDEDHEAAEMADAQKKEKKGYTVLTKQDLLKEMQKLSSEVMESLSVSSEEAFLLLRHFKYALIRYYFSILFFFVFLFSFCFVFLLFCLFILSFLFYSFCCENSGV
jgi:hypothetical protein